MGADKASLTFKGVPIWRRQIAVLETAGADGIIISGRDDGPWRGGLWKTVPDERPGLGPVSGLLAGLEHSRTILTACLAVDMPGMSAEYLRGLIAEAARSNVSVVPKTNNRWEPLAAAYHRNILDLVSGRLKAGQYSLQRLLDAAFRQGLVTAKHVTPDESPLFCNTNTPAEWNAFTARGST
jgi:molybdopterin-guanine dinucleotide biosynthesis protein A